MTNRSSSEVSAAVVLSQITFDVLVWQYRHSTTTILHLLLVGRWYSTLGLLNMLY